MLYPDTTLDEVPQGIVLKQRLAELNPQPARRYAELAARLRKGGILVRDTEFDLLDRLHGLLHDRIAKAVDESEPLLSPYAHELNTSGTQCADDCPACRWASERGSR
jgi:hypothetical protein